MLGCIWNPAKQILLQQKGTCYVFAIRKHLIVISKIRAYGLCSDECCIALLVAAVLTKSLGPEPKL